MINFKSIRIAVDFDGTIVEHDYPGIGKEKLFAFQTLKEFEKLGARLILWTFRHGKELDEAVEFCRFLYNDKKPLDFNHGTTRKYAMSLIDADIYIDDKNVGGFPGWSEVWQMLVPFDLHQQEMERQIAAARKNSLRRLFGKKAKQNEE